MFDNLAEGARAEDADAEAPTEAEAEAEAEAPVEEEEEDFSDYSIDDSGETEEDAESAVDVLTTSVFMGRTKESIPAGSEISSLVGFHNVGNRPFILKSVQGSLRDATDFDFVLQNFTNLPVGSLIDGGEQASIMYKFLPENTLDPRDVTLEIVVTYSDEDDDAAFVSAAFNSTITITNSEQPTPYSFYVKWLCCFALLGYGAVMIVPGADEIKDQAEATLKTTLKAGGVAAAETGTSDEVEESWTASMNQAGKVKKSKK
jgi:hypothetical protein